MASGCMKIQFCNFKLSTFLAKVYKTAFKFSKCSLLFFPGIKKIADLILTDSVLASMFFIGS